MTTALEGDLMSGLLQILGALAVLVAFTSVQLGVARPSAYPALLLNVVGSALLAGLALLGEQWGFLLLEASWAIVSLWGVWRRVATA
jgi:hypothetical protein